MRSRFSSSSQSGVICFVTREPRPSLALLDAGRSRVMGLHDGLERTVWIAEGGEVDADLHTWVVDPFERGWTGDGVTRSWRPWRRSGFPFEDSLSRRSGPTTASTFLWRSYSTTLGDSPEHRIWGDLLAVKSRYARYHTRLSRG